MNHYDTLGVPHDADADTIKKAYRRKAKEHHSDREGGDDGTMAEINVAYQVLSDPEKRAKYDMGQGDDVDPLERHALDCLTQFFAHYLEEGDDENPLVFIRNTMMKAKPMEQARIDVLKRRIISIEKKCAKVRRKNAGLNLVEALSKQLLIHCRQQITEREYEIKTADAVLRLLDDYECDISSPQYSEQFDRLRLLADRLTLDALQRNYGKK